MASNGSQYDCLHVALISILRITKAIPIWILVAGELPSLKVSRRWAWNWKWNITWPHLTSIYLLTTNHNWPQKYYTLYCLLRLAPQCYKIILNNDLIIFQESQVSLSHLLKYFQSASPTMLHILKRNTRNLLSFQTVNGHHQLEKNSFDWHW